jgi:hypothetical protein
MKQKISIFFRAQHDSIFLIIFKLLIRKPFEDGYIAGVHSIFLIAKTSMIEAIIQNIDVKKSFMLNCNGLK